MSLIVVQYFHDLPALSLAKRQLEVAGIKVITRDELTTQVYSIESRATGGAKLLVDKKDYARASQILIDGGFMLPNKDVKGFWVVDFLDNLAKCLPGFSNLPKELRLVFMSFILIVIFLGFAFLFLI